MDSSKEILRRFVVNKFSFNDYLLTKSFFREEKFSGELKNCMEEEWNETESTGESDQRLGLLLDNLHHQINLKESFKNRPARSFYSVLSKIAVILLLPSLISIAALSYLLRQSGTETATFAEIHSPLGARTSFQLPDGTLGWLNSGSSIKYQVSFKSRKVEVSGEAWFDVVHQKSKTFQVSTRFFDVEVLGTQFNVVAYENENTAQVILERGKVSVTDKEHTVQAELVPNEQVVFNKATLKLEKSTIDSKTYTSWKDGVLIFKNEPMEEIARRLERRFNTEIILHGDSLKKSIFRATFREENLDEICRMLSEVTPIRYRINKREIQPDGSFAKGQIEMWLKN